MAGIMQKVRFIRDSVSNKKIDDETIALLYKLQKDDENLPIYKVPVSILATAALSVLGISKYTGTNENVLLWEGNLKSFLQK
ncbi:hypothetical protein NHG33_08545 [Aerococcaceae bacterium NML130460]|nr:hypothetical protein [Aerococcaceae bacterium NML130460]MDO4775504.1 hypothetical protein [Aerococcaceae bacterium]